MKLKKARFIVQSSSDLKDEWKEALSGKKTYIQSEGDVYFANYEVISKIFTKNKFEVINTIIKASPDSIYELSKILKHDFKNVHQDVIMLKDIGLIQLIENSESERKSLKPIAKFSGIDLDFAA